MPLVPFQKELTNYYDAVPTDPVACLQKRLDSGSAKLAFDSRYGYLQSLLKELRVPVESQVLVFSKTSLQRAHISAKTPRAIFFNDEVYVAWIEGAPMVEVVASDPKLGAVFYTLPQATAHPAHLARDNRCLECHITSRTLEIPGQVIRSFATSASGEIDLLSGDSVASHAGEAGRWGGWYVSDANGKLKPAASYLLPDAGSAPPIAEINLSAYPISTSDSTALLIFEHQTRMQNLITRLTTKRRQRCAKATGWRDAGQNGRNLPRYLAFCGRTAAASLCATFGSVRSFL